MFIQHTGLQPAWVTVHQQQKVSVSSPLKTRKGRRWGGQKTQSVKGDREEVHVAQEEEEEEEEECGAEIQEELQRRLCSPAGSMIWLPRRVFIRLWGRNQREERAQIRARCRRREEGARGGPEIQSSMIQQWEEEEEESEIYRQTGVHNMDGVQYCLCPEDGTLGTQIRTWSLISCFTLHSQRRKESLKHVLLTEAFISNTERF